MNRIFFLHKQKHWKEKQNSNHGFQKEAKKHFFFNSEVERNKETNKK